MGWWFIGRKIYRITLLEWFVRVMQAKVSVGSDAIIPTLVAYYETESIAQVNGRTFGYPKASCRTVGGASSTNTILHKIQGRN